MSRYSIFSTFSVFFIFILAACTGNGTTVRVTIPATQIGAGAPVYTATASFTPSNTPTSTLTFTPTNTASITPTPTSTPTATLTPTQTFTPTNTPTLTPSPTATPELVNPTPINLEGAPSAVEIAQADLSVDSGWSCGDFPCEDDIDGFLQRIRVPQGFELSHEGQFDGQVMQIVHSIDGRLFATVLEDGTRNGAVYVLNDDGTSERYSETIVSPNGLAFQPGTDVLYVTGRVSLEAGGALYRVEPNGNTSVAINNLPCCFDIIGNQPNGIVFGADGLLYMGIGALTDHAESPNPQTQQFASLLPDEAAILRVNPHTGEVDVYAQGLHNPFDIAFDTTGQLFATDMGLVTGEGDRVLEISEGANYGWPYYRTRGCADCPARPANLDVQADLVTLPNYTLPHGLTVYTGTQFPENMQNTLFVSLWNGTNWAQRIVWIDPDDPRLGSEDYQLHAFMTGLIRPSDVIVAPDGSLLVADFIYGHVWRISYTGGGTFALPTIEATETSNGFAIPTNTPGN